MGVFTRNIVVEILPGEKLPFRIYRSFEFHLGFKGSGVFMRCEEGFQYDGTSIPRGLRWLISPGDVSLLQCAGIHDLGFRDAYLLNNTSGVERREYVNREVMNQIMREAMIARNVRRWKRFMINTGLKWGSKSRWDELRNLENISIGTTN